MVLTAVALGLAIVSLVGAIRARGGDALAGRVSFGAMGAAVALAILARAPETGLPNQSDVELGWRLLVWGGVGGPVVAAVLVRTSRPALAAVPLVLGTLAGAFGAFVAYVVWSDAQPIDEEITLHPVTTPLPEPVPPEPVP
jgi:hypothetical protein